MKKKCLLIALLILSYAVFGQDESFETTVPTGWAASLGTLSISDDHYKLDDLPSGNYYVLLKNADDVKVKKLVKF